MPLGFCLHSTSSVVLGTRQTSATVHFLHKVIFCPLVSKGSQTRTVSANGPTSWALHYNVYVDIAVRGSIFMKHGTHTCAQACTHTHLLLQSLVYYLHISQVSEGIRVRLFLAPVVTVIFWGNSRLASQPRPVSHLWGCHRLDTFQGNSVFVCLFLSCLLISHSEETLSTWEMPQTLDDLEKEL